MTLAANTLAEVHPMSQTPITPRSFSDHPVAKTVSHTVPLIRAAVLGVSVLAAIPTAHNLYYSWAHGIPYAQVPHRLAQYDLWMQNLDCKIDYRQLATNSGTKVDVGACAKSGDIAIKVSSSAGHSSYEWIAFKNLQKPVANAGLLGLVVSSAIAEEVSMSKPLPAGAFKVAETGLQVMCQTKQGGDKLIRVVQEAGKCYREVMSLLKGSVDKREEVPCSTTCK
jgi:hypothetical protein